MKSKNTYETLRESVSLENIRWFKLFLSIKVCCGFPMGVFIKLTLGNKSIDLNP